MRVSFSFALATAALICAAPLKTPKKKASAGPAPVDTSAKLHSKVAESDSTFFKVKVGRQQSASWLAFRHLGAWTPEIAAQIRTDNPDIPNLNHLEIGQVLRLRRSLDQRDLSPAQQISKAIRKAVITYAKGTSHIERQGTSIPATANEFLAAGDKIVTGADAVVELVIDNQSVLRLRDKTILTLVAIQDPSNDQKVGTSVFLDAGRVWSKVRKWAGPLVGFQVKMPNAIAGVHGTTFECLVQGDSSGLVSVHEGLVSVTGRAQPIETPVAAGKSVIVQKDGLLSQPTNTKDNPPDWKRFNELRDQSLEETTSSNLDATQNLRKQPVAEEVKPVVQPPIIGRPETTN